MKTMVTGIVLGIVFSIALIFSNRTFASDTLPSCDYMIWKHGRYICADFDVSHQKQVMREPFFKPYGLPILVMMVAQIGIAWPIGSGIMWVDHRYGTLGWIAAMTGLFAVGWLGDRHDQKKAQAEQQAQSSSRHYAHNQQKLLECRAGPPF